MLGISVLSSAGLIAIAGLASAAAASSNGIIERYLAQGAGAIPGSEAEVEIEIRPNRTEVEVELDDVPVGTYTLFVAGENVGSIVVTPRPDDGPNDTLGRIEFRNPPRYDYVPLTFNPFNSLYEVYNSSNVLMFSGIIPSDAAPDGNNGGGNPVLPFVRQRVQSDFVDSTGSNARGRIRFNASQNRALLDLTFSRLPQGVYILQADGLDVAQFTVGRNGRASLRFSTNPRGNGALLDFDPTQTLFEVTTVAGDLVLSTILDGIPAGGGLLNPGEFVLPMLRSGPVSGSQGTVYLDVDSSGDLEFDVEIEDVPVGAYQLVVAGVQRGIISATVRPNGDVEGEIEFDTTPNEPGELPLTFDPRGQLVQVFRDGVVYFSINMPG